MIASNRKKSVQSDLGEYENEAEFLDNNLENNIHEIIDSHENWLSSGGKHGSRAVFMHTNFNTFDFKKINLSGSIFKNCNLSGCNFEVEVLEAVDFYGSNLRETIFKSKKLTNINFEKVNMSGALMSGIKFYECRFIKCVSKETDLIKSIFVKSDFQSSDFKTGNFHSSCFTNCTFQKSYFNTCDFSYTKISDGNFRDLSFAGSEFHGTEIISSDFERSTFESYKIPHSSKPPIKTILRLAKFINCHFKDCFFEESEKELKSKIITTANKKKYSFKSYIHSLIIYLTFTTGFLASVGSFVAISFFTPVISLLGNFFASVLIFGSSSIYTTYFYNCYKKISKKTSKDLNENINFISRIFLKSHRNKYASIFTNITFLLPAMALGTLWIYSLSFEVFSASIMQFAMFFYSLLGSSVMLSSIKR
jgi:uncharacterized protein YjbI with pentapeptide repeats